MQKFGFLIIYLYLRAIKHHLYDSVFFYFNFKVFLIFRSVVVSALISTSSEDGW